MQGQPQAVQQQPEPQQQAQQQQARPPLPPGPPPDDPNVMQRRQQAMVAAQATMLRTMQQQLQSGQAPPGVNPATLALLQARAAMMASMGMPVFGVPQEIQTQMSAGLEGQPADRAPPRPAPTVKVADVFKRPGRLKRPERIFIILRGLPGRRGLVCLVLIV